MAKYVSLIKQRLDRFSSWKLEHIPRDCNEKADALAAVAVSLPIIETVFLPIYYQPDSSIIATPGKLGGQGFLLLDGPHSTLYQHRRTLKRKEQSSQDPNPVGQVLFGQ